MVRKHRIQHYKFSRPSVEQLGCVLPAIGAPVAPGVSHEGEPTGRAFDRHLMQCRVELAARATQLIQGLLNVAAGAQAVMNRFQSGANHSGLTLLFAKQFEGRGALCDFAASSSRVRER